MYGDQAAIGPVAHIKCFLIFDGKFSSSAKDHTGGTTDADIHHRRQAVGKILRPLGAAFSIAVFAATHHMKRACGTIPWSAPVPFHVTVVAEKFAIRVESDVVIVALAGGPEFRIFPIEIHS